MSRRSVALTGVLGTALLGRSLSSRPGSAEFYAETASVAGVWSLGGLAAGRPTRGRGVLEPAAVGAAAFGAFYAAALVSRRIPVLGAAVGNALSYAHGGDDRLVLATTLANGVGEEVFFRGAVYDAAGDRPVLTSTIAYAASTAATRNPALVLAAGVMGTLFGWQRKRSGGIQAPVITHLTWSALMLRFLPPLFRPGLTAARRG